MTDEELTQMLTGLPAAEFAASRKDAERVRHAPEPEPGIPHPTFPHFGIGGGVTRFHCPLDCGWHHDDERGQESPGPIVLPVNWTDADLSDALTARAAGQGAALLRRVEEALRAHHTDLHPELARLLAQLDEDDATANATLWEGSGNRADWTLAASATVDVGTDDFNTNDRTIANHIVRHRPAAALKRVTATRALLADILAERHHVNDGDCWYTCRAAIEDRDGGITCDDDERGKTCNCGRNERIQRRIRILTEGWDSSEDPLRRPTTRPETTQ